MTTAVQQPVSYQSTINRHSWNGDTPNGGGVFMPRKSAQRQNSSSSLSSQASTASTVSATSQVNGSAPANPVPNGIVNGASNGAANEAAWAARKTKAPKGLWPATKTEPIAGITTARPQPIASTGPGASAASAMSALQAPAPMVPSQHNGAVQAQQQNGVPRPQGQEQTAVLHLVPMNGTFERKTITVPFYPDVLRIGRQTNNKTIPTPLNGYFDSKVLSRQHAEVWADRQGKIWIRDVKSSNGTFVNGSRLSQENRDSDPHELREQDMLELGIDIVSEDQKTIVHHKVAARVEHAGIYARSANDMVDLNFGELEGQQMSNMMSPNAQQQLANMRGRTPSQGSMNGQRMQGPGVISNYPNGMQQPRHPNFWLQPITMEQVVKKLNVSLPVREGENLLRHAGRDQSCQTTVTGAPTDAFVYQRHPDFRPEEGVSTIIAHRPDEAFTNQGSELEGSIYRPSCSAASTAITSKAGCCIITKKIRYRAPEDRLTCAE